MTAPPDEIAAKVREWAGRADDDLRVAEHTLTLPDECPYRLVAYHCGGPGLADSGGGWDDPGKGV